MSLHRCEPHAVPYGYYGPAISLCHEPRDAPGEFWVGNGEKASRVNFCPFCGEKAPKQVDWEEWAIAEEVENVKRREAAHQAMNQRMAEAEARRETARKTAEEINADALYPCTDKVLEAAGWDKEV